MGKGLFFSLPAHGHINPVLPVVRELVRAGEEIVVYTQEAFRKRVEETGARFRAYPTPRARSAAGSHRGAFHKPPHLFRFAALLMLMSTVLVPRLLQRLREENYDYVIHDSIAPWGRYIARLLGLPTISSSAVLASDIEQFRRQWSLPALFRATLRYLPALLIFKTAGLALKLRYGVRGCGIIDVFTNRGDLNIVYTSREFQPAAERFDASYRFVGRTLSAAEPSTDAPWSGAEGKSVLYVSLGTIHSKAPEFFRACFAELAGVCDCVVISVGKNVDPLALQPVPHGFYLYAWLSRSDLLALLSRANVFVTHGGITSVSEGLYHATPLVLLPQTREQAATAQRVQELGAGVDLGERLTAGALRTAVERVLKDPAIAAAARELGGTLRRAGGEKRAAREILDFVALAKDAGRGKSRT